MMTNLIRYSRETSAAEVFEEEWQVFRPANADELSSLPAGKVMVPFVWWLQRGGETECQARAQQGQLAVWLSPEDDVLAHRSDFQACAISWPLIAVDFPVFKDGRGYSTASILRQHLGWKGELRAIGDILIDQLLPLARVGFDSFAVRGDQNIESALAQFSLFSVRFQDDWRQRRSQLEARAGIGSPKLWQIPSGTVSGAALSKKTALLFQRLKGIASTHSRAKFATSLAAEDMVITDAILGLGAKIGLFTLDTGRLHSASLEMMATVESHYGVLIERFTPVASSVEEYVAQYGLNGFYESEEARKRCCHIRKVEPLNRALADADAWLSGQRREQSATRQALRFAESDEIRGIAKYNPLFDWSEPEIWAYLLRGGVPVHPLHRRGYPSIGCEPCTIAVRQGMDIRSGRWYWLHTESKKECGLHVK